MFNQSEEMETKQEMATKEEQVHFPAGQTVFQATISDFFDTSGKKSYGSILLYDWTTQKHLLRLFSDYKKERVCRLRADGVRVRKNRIRHALRDADWARLVGEMKKKSYKEAARVWAERNTDGVMDMFLQHVWKQPELCESLKLRDWALDLKKRKQSFQVFLNKVLDEMSLKEVQPDLDAYVSCQLPPLIRAAVFRYNKKP